MLQIVKPKLKGQTMRHLNISFYTDTYYPAIDGVVTSIREYKRALESRGHEVRLLTSGTAETRKIAKLERNVIVTPSIKFKRYPQYSLSIIPFVDVRKRWAATADIIHIHTPFTIGLYGLLSGYINHVPVVWTFHTLVTNKDTIDQYTASNRSLRSIAKRYSWPYLKFIAKRCNVVVAPTETVRSLLNRKGIKNTVVIPNGVDLNRFKRNRAGAASLRKRLLAGNRHMVLYVGRISKEKNIETMVRAANLLREKRIMFVIVGEGPYSAKIRKMVESYKLEGSFTFVGSIRHGLAKYYNAADMLCLPSTFETQGIVCIEAMACGIPVVGADFLALKEIIKNGKNGERFKAKDFKDCANKIEKVLSRPDSYKETEKTIKDYSINECTDRMLKLYNELIIKNRISQ